MMDRLWPLGLLLAGILVARGAEDVRRTAAVTVVEEVLPSVVNIQTEVLVEKRDFFSDLFRDFYGFHFRHVRPEYSLGSGVFVDERGYIMTNAHVVQRASRIQVVLHDGRKYEAEFLGLDMPSDIALIRVRQDSDEVFPAIRFARPEDLLLGETVIAMGNPFGLGSSISKGILSSKNRRPEVEGEMLDMADWIQTDAAINPGNSGGPLVNLKGEMIGLNVAVYREGEGIGFAVPVHRITEALSGIFESGSGIWYGASVEPHGEDLVVSEVGPGSPAREGGLRVGDRIVSIQGASVDTLIDYFRMLAGLRDRTAEVVVRRGDGERSLRIRILSEEEYFNAELIRERTGLALHGITRDLRRYFRMQNPGGLIVSDVVPDSPAGAAGVLDGGVLVSLDGRRVTSVVQVAKIVDAFPAGETLSLRLRYRDGRGQLLTVFEEIVPD